MRTIAFTGFLVAFTLNLLAAAVFGQQSPPDLILTNGKIFTSNSSQPYVEALAIRGERILAAGTSKEISALAGKQAKRIDLGGRTVIPGINDAHVHLGGSDEDGTYQLNLGDDPSWKEIKEAVSSAVAKVSKGVWIGGGFGPVVFDDPDATRTKLDELAPDNPVWLTIWGGHAALLNSAALRKLGIREDEPDPEGGMYVRNPADGKLTGMVLEFAAWRTGRHANEHMDDQHEAKSLHDSLQTFLRFGVTTVQDMSNIIPIQRAAALLAKNPPPIRVRAIWFGLTDQHGRLTQERRSVPRNPSPLVTVSGTKWILDGTPIERWAAMREPYVDRPAASGRLDFSQKEMEEMLRESLKNNDQLMVHIAGDRTAETFLNAMEATGGEKVWSKRRVRIEHGDGLLPDLVPRAKRLGVIVVQNPVHFTLGDLFLKRFGEKRAQSLQPLRSLIDAGIPVAIGSDGPENPFLNIMFASTFDRHPAEAITREQAVIAYTLTAAYAEFAEKDKGSLEPGKLADLAVLSQDIFKVPAGDLPKTESLLTLVGGKIVYDAKVITVQ